MSSAPRSVRAAAALAILVGAPALAAAHISLTSPAARTNMLKTRPCGVAGSVRGANVTVLAPGATIMVRWTETIDHPGHYRVSFDPDGQDFTVPATANGSTMGETNVLMDLIPDRAGSQLQYTQMITLPNMTCENCTLQVIQMMTDKPPYTIDSASDDIYYQCADIALRAPAGADAGTDAPVGSPDAGEQPDGGAGATEVTGGCGCRTSSQGQPAGIAALVFAVGIATRRRRRD